MKLFHRHNWAMGESTEYLLSDTSIPVMVRVQVECSKCHKREVKTHWWMSYKDVAFLYGVKSE